MRRCGLNLLSPRSSLVGIIRGISMLRISIVQIVLIVLIIRSEGIIIRGSRIIRMSLNKIFIDIWILDSK